MESVTWYVLFGVGDERSDNYEWCQLDKSEYSKIEAKKLGERKANRLGENSYNYYFCIKPTYVTDNINAFIKKCNKVGLNPAL